MTCLLDVNVLVALAWRGHVLHGPAHLWFSGLEEDWVTTPLTEAGLLRISMNPRVVDRAVSWRTALRMLEAIRATRGHRRWTDDSDLVSDAVALRAPVVGHRQVTDVHLVALARAHGGHLATFDRGVADAVHPEDTASVTVIPAR